MRLPNRTPIEALRSVRDAKSELMSCLKIHTWRDTARGLCEPKVESEFGRLDTPTVNRQRAGRHNTNGIRNSGGNHRAETRLEIWSGTRIRLSLSADLRQAIRKDKTGYINPLSPLRGSRHNSSNSPGITSRETGVPGCLEHTKYYLCISSMEAASAFVLPWVIIFTLST